MFSTVNQNLSVMRRNSNKAVYGVAHSRTRLKRLSSSSSSTEAAGCALCTRLGSEQGTNTLKVQGHRGPILLVSARTKQTLKCFGSVSSNFSNLTQLEYTFKMRKNSGLKATQTALELHQTSLAPARFMDSLLSSVSLVLHLLHPEPSIIQAASPKSQATHSPRELPPSCGRPPAAPGAGPGHLDQ